MPDTSALRCPETRRFTQAGIPSSSATGSGAPEPSWLPLSKQLRLNVTFGPRRRRGPSGRDWLGPGHGGGGRRRLRFPGVERNRAQGRQRALRPPKSARTPQTLQARQARRMKWGHSVPSEPCWVSSSLLSTGWRGKPPKQQQPKSPFPSTFPEPIWRQRKLPVDSELRFHSEGSSRNMRANRRDSAGFSGLPPAQLRILGHPAIASLLFTVFSHFCRDRNADRGRAGDSEG